MRPQLLDDAAEAANFITGYIVQGMMNERGNLCTNCPPLIGWCRTQRVLLALILDTAVSPALLVAFSRDH
jgi:hypothetical protein